MLLFQKPRREPGALYDLNICLYFIVYVYMYTYMYATKSLQSCPTLCDPIDGSPWGSLRILQARILEWAAISFSNAWKWKAKVKSLSCVWFFVTPWTAAFQAPPSMGFSRQEYWSGVPLPLHIYIYDITIFLIAQFPQVFRIWPRFHL